MNIIRQESQTVLFIHAVRYFRRPVNFPNAILRITKTELSLSLLKFPIIRKIARESGGGGGGGALSNYGDRGPTPRCNNYPYIHRNFYVSSL